MIDKATEAWVIKAFNYNINPMRLLNKDNPHIEATFVGGLLKHVPEEHQDSVIPVRGGHVVIIKKESKDESVPGVRKRSEVV